MSLAWLLELRPRTGAERSTLEPALRRRRGHRTWPGVLTAQGTWEVPGALPSGVVNNVGGLLQEAVRCGSGGCFGIWVQFPHEDGRGQHPGSWVGGLECRELNNASVLGDLEESWAPQDSGCLTLSNSRPVVPRPQRAVGRRGLSVCLLKCPGARAGQERRVRGGLQTQLAGGLIPVHSESTCCLHHWPRPKPRRGPGNTTSRSQNLVLVPPCWKVEPSPEARCTEPPENGTSPMRKRRPSLVMRLPEVTQLGKGGAGLQSQMS